MARSGTRAALVAVACLSLIVAIATSLRAGKVADVPGQGSAYVAAESQRTPNRAQGAARRCMSTRGSDSQHSSARPSHLDWTDVCRQQREPVTGLRKRIARAVLAVQ